MGMSPEDIQKLAIEKGLPPEDAKLIGAMQTQVQTQTAFERIQADLFPNGVPTHTGIMGGFSSTEQTRPNEEWTDPRTGAIVRQDGVYVDPNADPTNGVYYDPNYDGPGSYKWLNNAAKWGESKVQKWRNRLIGLGYQISDKGGFDETFRTALDLYHRNKYFYGKVIPLDNAQALGEGKKAEQDAAYDPVLRRQDVRAAFAEIGITDPTDQEIQPFMRLMRQTMDNSMGRGKTPEHAALRAKEKFAETFTTDPIAQQFIAQQSEQEENTRLRDSLLSVAQITSR